MSVDYELLEQAHSADADIRQKAAARVASSPDEEALPLMFEMLGDRDWRVRKTIVDGLLRNPTQPVIRGLIGSLHDAENAGKRNSATEALIRIGDQAIPYLIFALDRETDVDVRLSLVNLMGDLRTDETFETLIALLGRENDINLVSSIISSIGRYRRVSSIPHLLQALGRDDLWLKFHAIEALGEVGDRAALPAILPLYAEKSLRKPILEAVGKIGDVGTVNFLLNVLKEEERLNLAALRALIQIAEADKPRVVEVAERHLIQKKFREAFPGEKVNALIEHLHGTPKREVKNFILKFLGWSGDERALDVLLSYLEDPESSEIAAQALIDFGSAATTALLQRLRASDEDEVTALLLRVVNMISGNEAIPSILGFLDHENPLIRRLAIETLGEILDPATIDYLLATLDDPDVSCQQAAVNAISALVAAFPETKNDTLAKIRRLLSAPSIPVKLNSLSIYVNIQGEGYHDELLLASKDQDPVIRQKAVSLMGKFSDELFADQLVLSLADESPTVRLAAINAIASLRPETGIEPLISSLEDTDIWIRTAAAQALGEYRHHDSIAPLIHHLRGDVPPVRIATIEALGKSESLEVRDVLFAALKESDLEIRRASILALARIPGDEVLEKLLTALGDDDWRLRASAAVALGMRGDRTALPALHQALAEDPDAYVQQSAVVALDKIGDRSSFPWLLKALDNKAILDDVSDVFVRHKEAYRQLLEEAWRTADSRREVVIAAILQMMKDSGI
ncbi:MAG TPA: HEAT repeat domain-containing protein [Thermoanaerobaculia bacterium]|nr:HEAT repeat domain-containing protein [Thermoanaerobaculia bacterium]